MGNPPAAVKLALESICLLLGEETNDWRRIRPVILRDNFISSIVNFDIEDLRYLVLVFYLPWSWASVPSWQHVLSDTTCLSMY